MLNWLAERLLDLLGLARPASGRCRRTRSVSWSPTALCTSAAATAESTPPDRPQMTRSPPTWARMASTDASMTDVMVHGGRHPHTS